jgi:hypothetical protein
MPAMPAMPVIAYPTPHPSPAPMAVRAPVIAGVPTPPPTPAPVALAFADHDFDFDFDYNHDSDGEKDRELGSGGKLTVDELITLRATGVTPEYVNKMRAIFPGLTLRQVTASARSASTKPSSRNAQRRIRREDAEGSDEPQGRRRDSGNVREMRAAGYAISSAKTRPACAPSA